MLDMVKLQSQTLWESYTLTRACQSRGLISEADGAKQISITTWLSKRGEATPFSGML